MVCKHDHIQKAFDHEGITHLLPTKALSFEENLQKVKNCKVVADFVNSAHSGLSFRIFDALCFNKKLITTNKTIQNYDFYHPNNIFIWENNNTDELIEFLAKPYVPIDETIKQYYSFTAWIKRILPNLD
ncbi:hypothetical protein EDC44_11279 [Cricetibacter osteomyelitidis]|uniref:Uncharacterized protein n=1 Tax=Cricetibacter osteomyelitidis TaxID=1521931 RepID=A0A4R2SZ59_9PAST|nr:hypothetical protein [Cricetibacter osteomyelitidis]TCP95020.1 hypothetical protein EDC44_11279 [Cricetibacter osteomyelitidis]